MSKTMNDKDLNWGNENTLSGVLEENQLNSSVSMQETSIGVKREEGKPYRETIIGDIKDDTSNR